MKYGSKIAHTMIYFGYKTFMKISTTFSKLHTTNALLIVSGKHNAATYILKDGEIKKLETIERKETEFDYKKGYFESRGKRGSLMSSGSGSNGKEDSKSKEKEKDFYTLVGEKVGNLKDLYEHIYLLAPSTTIKLIEAALPKPIAIKIKRRIVGNFTKLHPTTLLTKIKVVREKKQEKVKPKATGAAAKILKVNRKK